MTMRKVGLFMRKNTIVPIFFTLFIVVSIITPGFLSPTNLVNILLQSSINGVMALGATFLIINGYRDLSVGMLMALSASLAITLQGKLGPWGACIVAVAVALVVGFVNGFLVVRVGINTFIATLATMFGCRGIMFLYSGGRTMPGTSQAFADFGAGTVLGIPNLVYMFLALLLLSAFVLRYTSHGRNTYAAGGNAEAAANAGINTTRTSIINFMLSSLGAGLGGIMMSARTNSFFPEMGWPDTHFIVIVMVVLGGTKLSGGVGNVFYTLGGVLTLITFQNAFNLLKVYSFLSPLFTGIILIVTLYMDQVIKPVATDPSKTTRKKKGRGT